ncbi:hypothetical protein B296_00001161 [Ensete ventricosum]|uniref:Uncharacterized protein n=1 Tax=Ensete ventricosum TaxID=4639 RepID=A0A426YWR9_ENSVE|nr:hypothetical protein B296_00001161 [Ensete ventricosum]
MAAISFTRHQEQRLNHEARRTRVAPRLAAPKLSTPPTISQAPQPKELTIEELRNRSTKGLHGHCDKLWSLEHHCKKERPLMIKPTKEPKLEDTALESKEKDTPQPVILRGKQGSKATTVITQHLEKVPKEESNGFSIQIHEFQETKPKEIEDKNLIPQLAEILGVSMKPKRLPPIKIPDPPMLNWLKLPSADARPDYCPQKIKAKRVT